MKEAALLQNADVLPVVYSVVSADTVLTTVAKTYQIGRVTACQLLQRGLNATYFVQSDRARHIARLYGADWRSAEDVAYELELLGHVASKGVEVPLPIPDRGGRLMAPVEAPEGVRQLVLFRFVEGTPLSWENPHHCELAGRVAAQLHTAADDFVATHSRFCLDLDYLVDAQLGALRPFFEHRESEWSELLRIGARLREAAEAVVTGLDWGACHGDVAADNVRLTADGRLILLDLDLAAPGWRAYDLAAVAWVAANRRRSAIWEAFLRGYADVRTPAARDIEAVPIFHAIRRLWSLGLEAHHAPALGSYRLAPEYVQPALRFFRTWEAHQKPDRPETSQ